MAYVSNDVESSFVYFLTQSYSGVAVSKSGRKFSCFPASLDIENSDPLGVAVPGKFQLAELTGMSNETAYPNEKMNNPPGGSVNRLASPPVTKGLKNYFLGVQGVIIDDQDTLWAVDTGRVIDLQGGNSPLLHSSPGGCKLVGFNLANSTFAKVLQACQVSTLITDVQTA